MPHGEANLRRRGIMPIKDILVHVDESLACDNRLRVAADLAVRFDARLNGVGLAETVADKRFHVHLRRSGLAGEWHTGIGLPESFVTRRARVADLVVLGQPDPRGPAISEGRAPRLPARCWRLSGPSAGTRSVRRRAA